MSEEAKTSPETGVTSATVTITPKQEELPRGSYSVWVTHDFEGFHCWPEAPLEAAFLRDLHRHKFYVVVYVMVNHEDRDVEFFHLRKDVIEGTNILQASLQESPTMSCERMADFLAYFLTKEKRYVVSVIKVSEDNENGAVFVPKQPEYFNYHAPKNLLGF